MWILPTRGLRPAVFDKGTNAMVLFSPGNIDYVDYELRAFYIKMQEMLNEQIVLKKG
jgi:hypothetical protein